LDIAKKNNDLRAKKTKYNKYSDEKQELLPQYDQEKKKEGFVLGADTKAEEEKIRKEKLEALQQQLGGPDLTKMDLEQSSTFHSAVRGPALNFSNSTSLDRECYF